MKTLYLIRHAKSSWRDMTLSDYDRPLNKRGLRDAPYMAKMLSNRMDRPDKIISSPAMRAITTAGFFAKAFGIPFYEIQKEASIYEAYTTTILDLISNLPDDLHTVLMFGHNPTFTNVANSFSGSIRIANVPTCGICEVVSDMKSWKLFDGSTAELTNFYYPKQFDIHN